MVVAAFPIAKLAALLLRQISKPIANMAKERAKSHPFFRKYVCLPPAQFYNWCEMKSKLWLMHSGKPVNITVLSEQSAIELGASLLGETIIFVVAAAILTAEYARQSRKETVKETLREYEMKLCQSRLNELYFEIERQTTQIRELTRLFYDLDSRVIQKPWVSKPDKKPDENEPKPPLSPPPQEPQIPLTPADSTQVIIIEEVVDKNKNISNNVETDKRPSSAQCLTRALIYFEKSLLQV